MSVRLGLVSYLNSKPIGFGLVEGRQRGFFDLIQEVPSRLADALTRGELDLALMPSVEYLRNRAAGRAAAIVPGIAIASHGAAGSVLLFSRLPLAEIHDVCVDRSSRTSAALLRLLFRRRFRPGSPEPRLLDSEPDLPVMLDRCDAALVIGDRALLAAREHPMTLRAVEVTDLGSEWTAMTGLPFVFAFWAGPGRDDSPEIVARLQDSLAEGLERIPEIARRHAGGNRELESILLRYLASTIRYGLGREELRGLETFYGLLAEEGLVAGPLPRLLFHPTRPCEPRPDSGRSLRRS